MRWVGHVALREDMRGACRVLVGRPDEKKKRLGRRRLIWEDNIKMNLQEAELEGMEWIAPALDCDWWWAVVNAIMNAVVNAIMNLLFP